MTNSELADQLQERTEGHLKAAIEVFQNLSEAELLRPSATGGWSIVQCLAHLNTYADYYYPRLQKALEKGEPGKDKPVSTGWMGNMFVRMMDPDRKAKYKAIKRHQPAENVDAARTVSEFISQQEHFLKLLQLASQRDLTRGKIPTSLSPFFRLNVAETLLFLEMHTSRHIRQAWRNVPRN